MRIGLRRKFGENLRQLRRSRNLTQEALAERCDLSVDAIRRIEWGTISPSLDTLTKLATGLGITLRTMFETLESGRRSELSELCDFLATRSRRELRLVSKVVRVMLENL